VSAEEKKRRRDEPFSLALFISTSRISSWSDLGDGKTAARKVLGMLAIVEVLEG
jgi:hypothetical protein